VTQYGAILADPPWTFKVRSEKGEGRSASQHYGTMDLDAIAGMPVASWAAKDACLFLWATDPMLPEALRIMRAWGFAYKTVAFYWAKTNRDGSFFTGMGYWTRANTEMCLLGTRGRPQRISKSVRRLIVAPRREHSRKPEEIKPSIERLVPGPYLEMFSRENRDGWDSYGNETGKFDAGMFAEIV
jgi:N6-adenosine-specific RNA methylase IME4